MITFTWIITAIAIISLLIGIISTIAVRVESVPNWRKVCKIIYWIIGVIIFRLLIWWFMNQHEQNVAKTQTSSEIGVVRPKYEWTWKLPRGVYIRGRNCSSPNEKNVEVIFQDNGSLWINKHYLEYNKPEVCRIRLTAIGDKSWEGTWEQENPPDHGRCNLNEIGNGIWAGHITGTAGIPAFCTLKRK